MKSLAKELTDQLSQNSMDTAFSDSWKSPETYLKSKADQRRGLKHTEGCRARPQQCSYTSSVHVKK